MKMAKETIRNKNIKVKAEVKARVRVNIVKKTTKIILTNNKNSRFKIIQMLIKEEDGMLAEAKAKAEVGIKIINIMIIMEN